MRVSALTQSCGLNSRQALAFCNMRLQVTGTIPGENSAVARLELPRLSERPESETPRIVPSQFSAPLVLGSRIRRPPELLQPLLDYSQILMNLL
ncbi:hypothetical protein ACVIJW_011147 [Bradyrhizobium barranii subsp. barranii]